MPTVGEVLQQGWRRHQQGDLAGAVGDYQLVLDQFPQDANAWCYLGIAYFDLGRFEESERAYREAIRIRPEFTVAWSNLGNTLSALGRCEEGLDCCREALRLQPDYATARSNYGAILVKLGRFGEAADQFREAVQRSPDNLQAQRNLGAALVREGRAAESEVHSREALRINPRDADAHKNLGIVRLLMGDFEQGWEEYEWRWRTGELRLPELPQPLWDGGPLEGRTILLHAEQGLGDTLHFVRFAPLIGARGGRVVVQCQAPLTRLLGRCPGIDQVVPRGAPLPKFDVHAPLLGLPRLLGIRSVEQIPAPIPYLDAEPQRVERWRRRLDPERLNVGIVWQGSPDHHADAQRSTRLARWAPIAAVPGVRLHSLQKGLGVEQLAEQPTFGIVDHGEELDRDAAFLDTAALMRCLDLVICTDTSVAHLAGGLGVPTWVALCVAPDWRWLLEREDSPWYPTMRLFRQRQVGEWDEVFQRIAAALREQVADRSGAATAGAVATGGVSAGVSAVRIDVAAGELVDKLTILEIKRERIHAEPARGNVLRELQVLEAARDTSLPPSSQLTSLTDSLRQVNLELWDIEDRIRVCERNSDFGPEFIELARSVYRQNDRRALLKRQINELLGSTLIEEKSYATWRHEE